MYVETNTGCWTLPCTVRVSFTNSAHVWAPWTEARAVGYMFSTASLLLCVRVHVNTCKVRTKPYEWGMQRWVSDSTVQCTWQETLVHHFGYTLANFYSNCMLLARCSEDIHMQKGIWPTLLFYSSLLNTNFSAIINSVGLYQNGQFSPFSFFMLPGHAHTHTQTHTHTHIHTHKHTHINIRMLMHKLSTCKHTCMPTNIYNMSSFSSFVLTQRCMQVHRWMVWSIVIEMHNEREHATHWNKEHDLNRPFVLCFAHFALLSPQSMEANCLLADQSKLSILSYTASD
jgi:hypothetical protein